MLTHLPHLMSYFLATHQPCPIYLRNMPPSSRSFLPIITILGSLPIFRPWSHFVGAWRELTNVLMIQLLLPLSNPSQINIIMLFTAPKNAIMLPLSLKVLLIRNGFGGQWTLCSTASLISRHLAHPLLLRPRTHLLHFSLTKSTSSNFPYNHSYLIQAVGTL